MNLLRALATVSSMTLLSRVLGFVRDTVIARVFGAGAVNDAFVVAFRLPNLLRRLFAEGAFSQAFVPVLAEYRNRQGAEATRPLVDRVATLLTLAVALVSLLGIIGAPLIIWISAPGFSADADKFALTVHLTRITFPYILFMALVAFAGGILNTWSRFTIPAFTPVLLNLSFIFMALFAAPYFDPPVLALAWAVFIGGALQLGLQVRPLMKIGMLPRPAPLRAALADPGVRRILTLMAPAIFGVSIGQLSLLINTIFASYLVTGSVSWLYYADRLMEFPSGLLGAALGTILLPSLSRLHAGGRAAEFSALLDWGLRLTLMLTLPAALGLALLAVPLIATLFQYGAFSAADTLHTRDALLAYSVGLPGLILVRVLAPSFYARQDIRTPVKIGIITLAATQLMNLVFIVPLAHAGLALSIGLAASLNAALLYLGLRRRGVYAPQPGWGRFILQLSAALTVMGIVLWLGSGDAAAWFARSGTARASWLAGVIVCAAAGYFAALFALGVRPRDFRRRAIE
jgi:putative peptidoglycan lipid II flippase